MKLADRLGWLAIAFSVVNGACAPDPISTRVCQLTGVEDRSTTPRPTGMNSVVSLEE